MQLLVMYVGSYGGKKLTVVKNPMYIALEKKVPVPEHLLSPAPGPEKPNLEWTLPGFISIFLPEFPHRRSSGQQHLQILGFIAKGSYGPILKVKDLCREKTYAIKVLPKSEILKHGVLQQSKEEVIIQRQVRHPFLHDLQDCWQTQHHLFIMCDYYSAGDLYTYWMMMGCFQEDELRVFAAELGSCASNFLEAMRCFVFVLSGHLRLADFGLSRRLEHGRRAFTICGTIQYMAPEVLSGGPYNHAADWWSLGILLFSLATGKFPVAPEPEHCSMLRKTPASAARRTESERKAFLCSDLSFSLYGWCSFLVLPMCLQLLCKTPAHRLHSLERLQRQAFFRGTPFDAQLLQKAPVQLILELKSRPDHMVQMQHGLTNKSFQNFDCNFLSSPISPTDLSPTLANLGLN
uniref:Ribosomal protein S6 kinase related a n=1 Tax=Scleropages formosus TaxID=113540 RepID=A0A8C9R1R7_SCLFO